MSQIGAEGFNSAADGQSLAILGPLERSNAAARFHRKSPLLSHPCAPAGRVVPPWPHISQAGSPIAPTRWRSPEDSWSVFDKGQMTEFRPSNPLVGHGGSPRRPKNAAAWATP